MRCLKPSPYCRGNRPASATRSVAPGRHPCWRCPHRRRFVWSTGRRRRDDRRVDERAALGRSVGIGLAGVAVAAVSARATRGRLIATACRQSGRARSRVCRVISGRKGFHPRPIRTRPVRFGGIQPPSPISSSEHVHRQDLAPALRGQRGRCRAAVSPDHVRTPTAAIRWLGDL